MAASSHLLILLLVSVSLLPFLSCIRIDDEDKETRSEFFVWMKKHNRQYKDASELEYRYEVFKEKHSNIQKFEATNFQISHNSFSDLTPEEFDTTMLMDPIFAEDAIRSLDTSSTPAQNSKRTAPASIDWRSPGKVGDVADQGSCGDCWAFAAGGAIQSAVAIGSGLVWDISYQNILDCTSGSSCSGGQSYDAFQAVINEGGLDGGSGYPLPYMQAKFPCFYQSGWLKTVAKISGYVNGQGEQALMDAVANGPVVVYISASANFQSYSSGIFSDSTCASTPVNHAVLVVGYQTLQFFGITIRYWIIKNSWGTGWGDSGYVNMLMGQGICNIGYFWTYPTVSGAALTWNNQAASYEMCVIMNAFFGSGGTCVPPS